MSISSNPRLDLKTELRPGNAAAAIILIDGAYLLQLRDNKREIFFPACWGCFGGATEPGESCETALLRELHEELELSLDPTALQYFSRFDFDLAFAGLPPVWRYFYTVELEVSAMETLRLHEGAAMRLFQPETILANQMPLTPYDAFALWLHINRHRLIA